MSSTPLSYTPYQSHRRATSTASIGMANGGAQAAQDGPRPQPAAQAQGQRIGQAKNGTGQSAHATSSSNHFVRTPITNPSAAAIPAAQPRQKASAAGVPATNGKSPTSSMAPPPLRSVSSLRSNSSANVPVTKVSTANATSLQSPSKGKTNADQESSRAGPSAVSSPARRSVSSSLTVPSHQVPQANGDQGAGSERSGSRQANHIKRNSLTPSPVPDRGARSSHTHSRSLSSSTIPANLPQIMSTAQRLRSGSPMGLASPLSSSPLYTPNPSGSPTFDASHPNSAVPHHLAGLSGPNEVSTSDSIGRITTYRPGFQPKGAYRVRTDEFMAARAKRKKQSRGADGGAAGNEKTYSELESERLERRLEKVLAVHYDETPIFTEEEALKLAPTWLPGTIRKARLQAEADRRIREEEMSIVKWENDGSRKQCPICSTPFSLTVRKHHCRLCGRVVCASPHLSMPPGMTGQPPARGKEKGADGAASGADSTLVDQIKCSGLMMADGLNRGTKIKEVPRWDEIVNGGGGVDQEGRSRGVRACRDCKETILHRQYMLDDGSVPAYVKLYETLRSLQKEIEQSLPEFQEMILGLQKHDAEAALGTLPTEESSRDPLLEPLTSTTDAAQSAIKAKNRTTLALQRDAAQARKQLLANFANYDLIAKKIRNLDDEGNASLTRIKMAIYTQANVFLQTNMFPLQNLPKLSNKPSSTNGGRSGSSTPTTRTAKTKTANASATASTTTGQSRDEIAESITVLEQQLGLVRQYAASASEARKLQDAKSLQASARDLEAEIARLRKLTV